MKTIGLIDYYISEFHANNYPSWIKSVCEETGQDMEVKYIWAEEDISPVDGRSTEQWCKDFGVTQCNSIEELCEKSDYIMILAPSNPEKHLEYVKKAFPFGKNTYVDKTFAPDPETAETIFQLGEQFGTRFFSSSALRYAPELSDMDKPLALIVTGRGESLEEYIIHQIEMAVKVMEEKPLRVKVENQAKQYICTIDFENEKRATLVYAPALPFMAVSSPDTGNKPLFRQVQPGYFVLLTQDILRFFETGEHSFDPRQTLDVAKIRAGIISGKDALGQWVPIA